MIILELNSCKVVLSQYRVMYGWKFEAISGRRHVVVHVQVPTQWERFCRSMQLCGTIPCYVLIWRFDYEQHSRDSLHLTLLSAISQYYSTLRTECTRTQYNCSFTRVSIVEDRHKCWRVCRWRRSHAMPTTHNATSTTRYISHWLMSHALSMM